MASQRSDSVFHELLKSCGYMLAPDGSANTLDRDQALFQKALTKSLYTHPLYSCSAIVPEFVRGLEQHIASAHCLKSALMFTESVTSGRVVRAGQQDSLLRLLLNTDQLQPAVVALMVEKLLEIAYDSGSCDADVSALILANLQGLELVKDADFVCDKMLELLESAPLQMQKDVIAALPEIVSDCCHNKMADKLCGVYFRCPQLSGCILEALSSLSLSQSQCETAAADGGGGGGVTAAASVRRAVLKAVAVTPTSQLPAVVQFLLDGSERADQCIAELHSQMRVTPAELAPCESADPGATSVTATTNNTNNNNNNSSSNGDSVSHHILRLLANIRFAFQVAPRQYVVWLKTISSTRKEDHRPLDLLLLLVLHQSACEGLSGGWSQTSVGVASGRSQTGLGVASGRSHLFVGGFSNCRRRVLVENVLKKQLKDGVFTVRVLKETFQQHTPVLINFFTSLKHWATMLVRSSSALLADYGVQIYSQCVLCFGGQRRHETMMALVGHGCEAAAAVRLRVLGLLTSLGRQRPDIIGQHRQLVKSWLDYTDRLSLDEWRLLYQLLLCNDSSSNSNSCSSGGDDDALHDEIDEEVRLLISKQLASVNIRYKRIGVVGTVTALKTLSEATVRTDTVQQYAANTSTESSSSCQQQQPHALSVALLEAAEAAVRHVPAAGGQLLDELGSCVWRAGFSEQLEHWLCDRLMQSFQDTYVVDLPVSETESGDMRLAVKFGLDDDADGNTSVSEIAINLYPMLASESSSSTAHLLPASLRLLRLCVTSLYSGSLELLDALLSCPLLMPSDRALASYSTLPPARQHSVLAALFVAANFFRELLNVFATQKDVELKKRCVQRLRDTIALERQIGACLMAATTPAACQPPCARFDLDPPAIAPSPLATATASKRKGNNVSGGKNVKRARKTHHSTPTATTTTTASSSCDDMANTSVSQLVSSSLPPGTAPPPAPASSSSSARHGLSGCGAVADYRLYFRELDLDVFKLLYRRFSLTENTAEPFCLRPSELIYLLADLHGKLAHCLSDATGAARWRGGGGAGAGSDSRRWHGHLHQLPVEAVVRQTVTLLKPLAVIVAGIVQRLQSQSAAVADSQCSGSNLDDQGEREGEEEESALLNQCLGQVYRLIGTVITWPGFDSLRQTAGTCLLTEAVCNLDTGSLTMASSQLPSTAGTAASSSSCGRQLQLAAAAVFERLAAHAALLTCLSSAAHLVTTLAALYQLAIIPTASATASASESRKQHQQQCTRLADTLSELSLRLLQRRWPPVSSSSPLLLLLSTSGPDTAGSAHTTTNRHVLTLLQTYLLPGGVTGAVPLTVLNRLRTVCSCGFSELLQIQLDTAAAASSATAAAAAATDITFNTLNKGTFLMFYRCVFSSLLAIMRTCCDKESAAAAAAAGGGGVAKQADQLQWWTAAAGVFSQLVTCVRVISTAPVIAVCLKFSRQLVELFVRGAVPLLEALLRQRREEVMATLKQFQLSARYLHHVCNHSKCSKNTALMRYVPTLKKALETFVFRVKAMLAANGCLEAFWLGNLKNRDLQGDEILSQHADDGDSGDEAVEKSCVGENAAGDDGSGDLERDLEKELALNSEADDSAEKPDSEISDVY